MNDEPTIGEFLVHDDRVLGLLNDRAITGYLLNVGIALARLVDFEVDTSSWRISTMLNWLWPCPPGVHGPRHQVTAAKRLVMVLRSDLTDIATGRPNPAARLPRHFPEVDWPTFTEMLPGVGAASVAPLRAAETTREPFPGPACGPLGQRRLRMIAGEGRGGPAPAGPPSLRLITSQGTDLGGEDDAACRAAPSLKLYGPRCPRRPTGLSAP